MPLTFVTVSGQIDFVFRSVPLKLLQSVFGMTNMNPNGTFKPFGIVAVIICVPTYMLILSLNTHRGVKFWTEKTHALLRHVGIAFTFLFRLGKKAGSFEPSEDDCMHFNLHPEKRMRLIVL